MEHSFIDKYSDRDSLLHRLDPRVKIICLVGFIILMVLTPPQYFHVFGQYFLVVVALLAISRIPFWFFIKRSLIVIPFVIAIAFFIPFFKEGRTAFILDLWLFKLSVSYEGILIFWNVLAKAWLSIMVLILLSATTKFSRLLKGLEKLKFPKVLIMNLSFMYRYLFLITDEAQRMGRARNMRYFGGQFFRQLKVLGNMIGSLFIRSYERAERVYAAMCARGFDGTARTINPLKIQVRDLCFTVIFSAILMFIFVGWYI